MRQQQEQKSTIWSYGKKLLTGTVALGATWLGYHYLSSLFETPIDGIDIVDAANDELLTLTSEMNVGIASLPAGSRHLLATPTVINNIPTQTVELGVPFSFDFSPYFNDLDNDIVQYQLTSLNGMKLPSELSFEPKLLSTLSISGNVVSVEVSNNNKTAYFADRTQGLVIVDVQNPAQPTLLSTQSTAGTAKDIAVFDNIVYVAAGGSVSSVVEIFDVSDPANPIFVPANVTATKEIAAITIANSKLYVALTGAIGETHIYDIGVPTNPVYENQYNPGLAGPLYDVFVSGDTMYLAHSGLGVRIVDVTTLTEIGFYKPDGMQARGIAVSGNEAELYVANGNQVDLLAADISNPLSPVTFSSLETFGQGYKIKYHEVGKVLLADGSRGLLAIDVSTPDPKVFLQYDPGGSIRDLASVGDIIYLADDSYGFHSIDLERQGLLKGTVNKQRDLGCYRFNVSAIDRLGQVSSPLEFTFFVGSSPRLIGIHSDISVLQTVPFQTVIDANLLFNEPDSLHGQQFSFDISSALPSWIQKERVFSLVGSHSSYNPPNQVDAMGVDVINNKLYISDRRYGLDILDVSDPLDPQIVGGRLPSPPPSPPGYGIFDISVRDHKAFLAKDGGGLWVVDVSDPTSPTSILLSGIAFDARDFKFLGDIAYIADNSAGLRIVDTTNATSPVLLGTYSQSATNAICLRDNIAYLSVNAIGVVVLNVSDSYNPFELSTFSINPHDADDIAISGSVVYVGSAYGEFLSIDVSDPMELKLLDRYDTPDRVYGISIIGKIAFIADGSTGLIALDITDPSNLRRQGGFPTSNARDVKIISNMAYIADGIPGNGIKILSANKLKLSGTPTQQDVGNTEITITGTDEVGLSVSTSFTLRVEGSPVQAKPLDNQSAEVDQLFSFVIPKDTFTDPNNDPISIVATVPSWLTYNDASKVFSGTPASSNSGLHQISMMVSDGVAGTADIPSQFTVLVHASQTAVISSGHVLNFQVPDNTFQGIAGPLTYLATLSDGTDLPDWMEFDGNTLTFSGTPTESDVNEYNVVVTATDPSNVKYPASFLIRATVNQAPIVKNPIPNQVAKVNEQFLYVVPDNAFEDPNSDAMTYSVVSALPSWLTFNPATRTFSGEPDRGDTKTYQDRVHDLIVQASDGITDAKTKFTLNVEGESHLELAIKIGGPIITAVGLLFALYHKRALLINYCRRKRYQTEGTEVPVGASLERALKRVTSEQVERVRVFKKQVPGFTLWQKVKRCSASNERKIAGGADLPAWMIYDDSKNTVESRQELRPEDEGTYTVQAEGKAGLIKEKFEVTVVEGHTPRIFVTPTDNRNFMRGRSMSDSSFVSSEGSRNYDEVPMNRMSRDGTDLELANLSSS